MTAKSELLNELYQARFDGLKELAVTYNLPKNGSVEVVRGRLIQHLILDQWDLSPDGIKKLMTLNWARFSVFLALKNQALFVLVDSDSTFTSTTTRSNLFLNPLIQ